MSKKNDGLREYLLPMKSDEAELLPENPGQPHSFYASPLPGETGAVGEAAEEPLPGLAYRVGFFMASELGMTKAYLQKIAGINHLYIDNNSVTPISGRVWGIAYNGFYAIVAYTVERGIGGIVLARSRTEITEYNFVKTGFLGKKTYYVTRAEPGLFSGKLAALARTRGEGGEEGPSVLFYQEEPDSGLEKRLLASKTSIAGWNGEWYGVWEYREKNTVLHILVGDSYKRYVFPKDLLPIGFMGPWSLGAYNGKQVALTDGIDVVGVELGGPTLLWRKRVGRGVRVAAPPMERCDRVLAYHGSTIIMYSLDTGAVVKEMSFEAPVSHASIDGRHAVFGVGHVAVVYELTRWRRLGSYRLNGVVNGVSIGGKRMLIGYTSPAGVPRVVYADYGEAMGIRIDNVEMASGGKRVFRVGEITPSVTVLRTTTKKLHVYVEGNNIVFRDTGSDAGEHVVVLEIGIHGFLPLEERIRVRIKRPESPFAKIRVPPKPLIGPDGPYLPLYLEPILPINKLYAYIYAAKNTVVGAAREYSGIEPREIMVPLKLFWAREGVHEATIEIYAWSGGKVYREQLRTRVIMEKDWFEPVLKVMGGIAYLWSPFHLESVKILFEGGGGEYSVITNLRPGWNDFEIGDILAEKARIITRSGAEITVIGGYG